MGLYLRISTGVIFTLLFACVSSDRQSSTRSGASDKSGNPVVLAVVQNSQDRAKYEATAKKFIVATQGRVATEVAKQIFASGGNIIDAAVAASFAISVERPQSTGIGGGGFLLFHQAKTGQNFAIDFRERAPLRASKNMYLDDKGEVVKDLSTTGMLAVGTPGLVAGLIEVHAKFGHLPLQALVSPAIALAENGFEVYPHLANAMKMQKDSLTKNLAAKKIFLKADGEPYKEGDRLVQEDLGKTLRAIAEGGRTAFYQGAIAEAIVNESNLQNGLITKKDLSSYQVKWRKPVFGSYKGFEIVSFPPPSAGGTHIVQILNFLESDSLKALGFATTEALHLEASAMQQVFADRAKYMGDPDFNPNMPLNGLLSKKYAASKRKDIDETRAHSADQVFAGDENMLESTETTNFSMMDADGNVVISTQTINGSFGAKVVVPGTGIMLNNEMDDFSAKPGSANLYGAIGGEPNSIQPLKTPLSSMAPMLVLKDKKPRLALGAPGGTRIITCIAQTILNYLDFDLSLYDSISAIRLHHQWKPDQIDLETPGPGEATVKKLQQLGYKVNVTAIPCRVNAVAKEGELFRGVADPRDIGSSGGE